MPANISTSSGAHRTYSFGEFTLDLDRGALLSAGADVKLRPKSFEVLRYLVEQRGLLVSKDELLEAIWGQTVVTEDSVTHCLIEIRRAIGDQSHEMIRTVPRRGYIFDLPVAASEAPHRSKFASIWPRWRFAVVIVLMLGVAALWWTFGIHGVKVPATVEPRSTAALHSIAVMPFLDMSPEQDQAYFADGISEEILNLLAQVPGLRVIARTSSFSFKGRNVDIATIAERLNVTHVLEGSVRVTSNRIRITAQLVSASTAEHLWSERYDREIENVFAVQDEISAAVVGAVREHLGLQLEAAPRVIAATNSEAREAYLRGRFLVVQRTPDAIEGAVREFEEAIALDPDYALAHAELAIASIFLATPLYGDLTVTDATARAAPHVEKAIALDPALAQAHAAAAYIFRFQWNDEQALTHFRQAIEINPNYAIAYNGMGVLLESQIGRYKEAFGAFETARLLDPLSIPAVANNVRALIATNRLNEADRQMEKLAAIYPTRYAIWRGVRTSLGGKWANLVLGHLDAQRIDPEVFRSWASLASEFAAIGLAKEARAIAEDSDPGTLILLGKHGDAVAVAEAHLAEDPFSLADRRDLGLALAGSGDYSRARPILEEMWQRTDGPVTSVRWSGLFRVDTAAALIAIRHDAGEEAEIAELVAAIKDNVRRYRDAGITVAHPFLSVDYEEGLAAYFAGEHERGLELIAKAAEDGFYVPQRQAYLQALYDDPGFAPIRQRQEARQTRERERFLTVVCTENPYAAVWQPAEGTCESFAAVP